MQFTEFSEFLNQIESTSSRNDMMVMLAQFLPKLQRDEIPLTMYLMQGRLVPNYEPVEFNFSNKLGLRALEEYVADGIEVNSLFKELGDLGLAAEEVIKKRNLKGEKLSIGEVYAELQKIALASGKGAQEVKMRTFGEMLLKLDPFSARYVSRVVTGGLRLGLSDKSVLDALSYLKAGDKSLRETIERAYGARADIGFISRLVVETKVEDLPAKLAQIKLQPGVPLASKLVEREKDSDAVFARMGACIVQPKLDGLRAQIHYADGQAHIFSRNMESLTEVFPDIVAAVKLLGVESLIIDSEAIGYDLENDTYLPFQETIQRRRKYDVAETAENIPVRAMAFDLLYLNGQDLSTEPVELRSKKLQELLSSSANKQQVINLLETKTIETAEGLSAYFTEQITKGLEGIIIKKLGTTYDPGTRNFDWIKLKANTQAEMVDTVDAVVLGYYKGQGVRAKFGVGALLVGLYDQRDGKFHSVAKVGTGMKDDDWKQIKADLLPLEVQSQPQDVVVQKILHPDVWVKPVIVMEIDADQITRSPGHSAAIDLPAKFETETKGRGLSLRFPRMKVWKRDKKAEQSTSVQELVRMFELRAAKAAA